jgi:hypothetical protein
MVADGGEVDLDAVLAEHGRELPRGPLRVLDGGQDSSAVTLGELLGLLDQRADRSAVGVRGWDRKIVSKCRWRLLGQRVLIS